jgi:hypothetical protein
VESDVRLTDLETTAAVRKDECEMPLRGCYNVASA